MAEDPIAPLRQAHADLSTRSTRFAIAILIVFTVGSLTLARAVRSMNSGDVQTRVRMIRGYEKIAKERKSIPTVVDELVMGGDITPPADITPAEARTKKRELEAALKNDVDGWFTIEQTALGSKFRFNILYWSPLLPFLLWIAFLYLSVNDAKMKAIRQVIRARMRSSENGSLIDQLEVGHRSDTTFGLYPARLATLGYVAAFGTLIGVVAYALAMALTSEAWLPGADVVRYLFVLSVYALLLTRRLRRRIAAEAAVVAGEPFEPRELAPRLRRIVDRLRAFARRRPRGLVWSGGGATLCSLLLTTATASCGEPRSGADLFLGRKGAEWPVLNDWTKALYEIASLGRWIYVASIVLAAIAIVFTLLTLWSRLAKWIDRAWVRDVLRCSSVSIFFFSLCEFGFIYVPLIGVAVMLPVLWELLYWLIPSLLYVWMTAIRKRHCRNAWETRVRPFLAGLYAPAILLVPAALILQIGVPGIIVYAIGVTLLAAGAVVMFESVAVVEVRETLPTAAAGVARVAEAGST